MRTTQRHRTHNYQQLVFSTSIEVFSLRSDDVDSNLLRTSSVV